MANKNGTLVADQVEAYLEAVPDNARPALEDLRSKIRATLPEADEVISYQVPTFKQAGHGVVAYAAFKHHYSLFVMSTAVVDAHSDALAGFETAKGTVKLGFDARLPAPLVKKLVRARIKENADLAAARTKRGPSGGEE